jgi:mRNA interferase HigB
MHRIGYQLNSYQLPVNNYQLKKQPHNCCTIESCGKRNKELLDKFVKKHADSKKAMQTFIEFVEDVEWQNLNAIKVDFNSVDYVSIERYVFDIGGNKYRVIAVIIFIRGVFLIQFVEHMLNTVRLMLNRYNRKEKKLWKRNLLI